MSLQKEKVAQLVNKHYKVLKQSVVGTVMSGPGGVRIVVNKSGEIIDASYQSKDYKELIR